jgi:hypothetical protein
VDLDRDVVLLGDLGDPAQRRLGDRVDRVRGERRAHRAPARLLDLVERAPCLGEQLRRLVRVLVVDQRRADHRAEPGVLHRPRGRCMLPVHVPEPDRPRASHLQARKPRAPVDVLALEPVLGGPDVLLEPLHQRQVVGVAPEQRHRRMRVRVDQPRDQRQPGGVDHLVARLRLDASPELLDHPVDRPQPDLVAVEPGPGDRERHRTA